MKTIDEDGIEKIAWAKQCYRFKKTEEIKKVNLYDGRIDFFFERKKLLSVRLIDALSSRIYPKDELSMYTNNGHLVWDKNEICIQSTEKSASMIKFIANKDVFRHLVKNRIILE